MSDYQILLKMFEKVNENHYYNYEAESGNYVIEIPQSDEYYNTYLIFDSEGNFKEIDG